MPCVPREYPLTHTLAMLSTLRKSLLPHQLETVSFIKEKESCLIAHECGNGKTRPVLVLLLEEQQSHPDRITLVVVPACIRAQWSADLERYGLCDVVIISMETVAREGKEFRRVCDGVVFHRVVIDEIHLLGDKGRKAILGVLKGDPLRVALSGTPIVRHRKDLANIAKFIGVSTEVLMAERMLRSRIELPPNLALPPLNITEWSGATPDDAEADDPLMPTYGPAKRRYIQLTASGVSKVSWVVRLVQDPKKCPGHTLVFTSFTKVNKAIVRGLRKDGRCEVRAIRGDVNKKDCERKAIYDGCKTDPMQSRLLMLYIPALRHNAAHIVHRIATYLPQCTVVVVQKQTASVGLNLQMFSSVVFLPGYCPMTDWQALKRLHRIGQTKPVHAHFIYWRTGIDSGMREKRMRKVRIVQNSLNEVHRMGSCDQKIDPTPRGDP